MLPNLYKHGLHRLLPPPWSADCVTSGISLNVQAVFQNNNNNNNDNEFTALHVCF